MAPEGCVCIPLNKELLQERRSCIRVLLFMMECTKALDRSVDYWRLNQVRFYREIDEKFPDIPYKRMKDTQDDYIGRFFEDTERGLIFREHIYMQYAHIYVKRSSLETLYKMSDIKCRVFLALVFMQSTKRSGLERTLFSISSLMMFLGYNAKSNCRPEVSRALDELKAEGYISYTRDGTQHRLESLRL